MIVRNEYKVDCYGILLRNCSAVQTFVYNSILLTACMVRDVLCPWHSSVIQNCIQKFVLHAPQQSALKLKNNSEI